jgi:hypothetical protein
MGKTFSTGLLTNALLTDASNNVGIGAAPSGSYKLEVTGTSRFTSSLLVGGNITQNINDGGINLYKADGTTLKVVIGNLNGTTTDEGYLALYKTNSETVRVRASGTSYFNGGNVGIGTSSPNAQFEVLGSTGAALTDGIRVSRNTLQNSQYGVINYTSGILNLTGVDTSGGGAIRLNTSDGTTTSERMRITSGGAILFGNGLTSVFQAGHLCIQTDQTQENGIAIKNTSTANNGNFITFINSSNAGAGSIAQTGSTSINYIATSDYRLKENILPIQNAIDRILKIKPVTYNWKDTDNEVGEGFIAHELQEVVPLAVAGIKDAINEDGTIKAQGIDYGKLTPLLVKAMQEQNQIIQELNERLNKAGL